jgi:NADPH2:quinone reductase
MKAIEVSHSGGPEVLQWVERPAPEPGDGDILVQADSIGVGMPDILWRRGRYPWRQPLPAIPGIEMTGRVAAKGREVRSFEVGDAVFVSARELPRRGGCYAQFIAVPAAAALPLPGSVDLEAAACLSNYQLAWHLLNSATAGLGYQSVLIHAAAGGVGSAVIELAKLAGKRVIAVCGGALKCDFARRRGADDCIDHQTQDVVAQTLAITGGVGVDLALDPLGGDRFQENFGLLAPLGLLVNFGLLRGPPDMAKAQVAVDRLKDSLALRLFSMHVFDADPARRRKPFDDLIAWLEAGKIRPHIHARLPLREAARAHEMLEGGGVLGKILLKP